MDAPQGNASKDILSAFDKRFALNRARGQSKVAAYADAAGIKMPKGFSETREGKRVSTRANRMNKRPIVANAIKSYQDRMNDLADKSIKVVDELLDTGKDRVRADLAMEMIRHRVGAPTQKSVSQSQGVVYVVSEAPDHDPIIEAKRKQLQAEVDQARKGEFYAEEKEETVEEAEIVDTKHVEETSIIDFDKLF